MPGSHGAARCAAGSERSRELPNDASDAILPIYIAVAWVCRNACGVVSGGPSSETVHVAGGQLDQGVRTERNAPPPSPPPRDHERAGRLPPPPPPPVPPDPPPPPPVPPAPAPPPP